MTPQPTSTAEAIENIIRVVAGYFGRTSEELLSESKYPEYVYPRHVAMYLSRKLTTLSFPDLGKAFNRHHTTVMNGCDVAERGIRFHLSVRRDVAECEARLEELAVTA